MKKTIYYSTFTLITILLYSNTVFAQKAYKKPIFKSCASMPVEQLDACFEEKLQEHISENLIYPNEAKRNDIEGTIEVKFKVDEYGFIEKIKTKKGTNNLLRAEAERIISLLPSFTFSEENKKPKSYKFSTSIVFKIDEYTDENKEDIVFIPFAESKKNDSTKSKDNEEVFTYSIIEEKTVYPGCEGLDNNERTTCFQQKLAEHLQASYIYPEIAIKYNIQGKVFVQFIVDRDGSITDIKIFQGVHALLDQAAMDMIKSLPKMTQPAIQRGKPVKMAFTIPIVFQLT